MQMTIDVGYDQVFQLARQLPPRDRKRLASKIAPKKRKPVPLDNEPRQDMIVLKRGDDYSIVQVPFPDTEEGRTRQNELERLQKEFRKNYPEFFALPTKEEIGRKRQEALRLIAECPVATPEDIDDMIAEQNEFRRLFRWRTT